MNDKLIARFKELYEGMTQKEVAEKSKLTEAAISELWNGKRSLTINSLEMLAKGVEMSAADVWEEAEQ